MGKKLRAKLRSMLAGRKASLTREKKKWGGARPRGVHPGERTNHTVERGPALDASLPLSARHLRLVADRIAYGLRHPHTPDSAILLDASAAEFLLGHIEPEAE